MFPDVQTKLPACQVDHLPQTAANTSPNAAQDTTGPPKQRQITGSCSTWPPAHSQIACKVPVTLFLQSVKFLLNGSATPWCFSRLPQLLSPADLLRALCAPSPGCWPVISDIPLDSSLELVLFKIFINELKAVEHILSAFADDAKQGGVAESLEGSETSQRNLDSLEHWAIIKMKFNTGAGFCTWNRVMVNTCEKRAQEERDLGVLVTAVSA